MSPPATPCVASRPVIAILPVALCGIYIVPSGNRADMGRGAVMFRRIVISIAILGLSSAANAEPAAPKTGRCSNLQARCAIEIGGQCDPETNRWSYRCQSGDCTARFNECVSRGLPPRKPATVSAAVAAERCASLQARCAKKVGGWCNPKTGQWRYECQSSASCAPHFTTASRAAWPRRNPERPDVGLNPAHDLEFLRAC